MAEPSSARQRNYAIALGIRFDPSITRRDLSVLIDSPRPREPNSRQRSTVRELGTTLPSEATFYDAVDVIWKHLEARAWICSVVRKLVGARWRHHTECILREHELRLLIRQMLDHEEFGDIFDFLRPTRSRRGDMWFSIPPKYENGPLFRWTENVLLADYRRRIEQEKKKLQRKGARFWGA